MTNKALMFEFMRHCRFDLTPGQPSCQHHQRVIQLVFMRVAEVLHSRLIRPSKHPLRIAGLTFKCLEALSKTRDLQRLAR